MQTFHPRFREQAAIRSSQPVACPTTSRVRPWPPIRFANAEPAADPLAAKMLSVRHNVRVSKELLGKGAFEDRQKQKNPLTRLEENDLA
jgi:hypothetical protein